MAVCIICSALATISDLAVFERRAEFPQRLDVFIKRALACGTLKSNIRQNPKSFTVTQFYLGQQLGQVVRS
jgi:hypothetical protein